MSFKNLKQFAASTDAQAFAIGAVLLIMIAVTATTIYLSINAPIETKECEFLHSTEVTDDFVALRSTISSLIHAESSVAYNSVPIKLTPTKESFIALPLASGTLSFSPNEGNISVRLSESGDGSPGIWTLDNFTGNYSLKYGNVNDTTGNLSLSGPPYASACKESIGNNTGSNSTVYGNITWHALTSPPATEIIMKVRTALDANMTKSTPWVEVENGTNLSTIFPTLNGHRYVQFRAELITWEPSKTPTLINVSIDYSHKNVIFANTSGTIRFKSSYHYFPNQVITYENGAVIKSQDDQEFIRLRPPLDLGFNISFQNVSANRTRINISLVNLTGANVAGRAGEATLVRLLRINNKTVSDGFFYSNMTLTVNSSYSHGIEKWFNKTLEKELNSSYYNVTANHTTGMVEIELYAKEQGIELYLEEATIGVEM